VAPRNHVLDGKEKVSRKNNVTLLAFAAERRVAMRLAAVAVDRYLPPAEPTAANLSHAAAAVDDDKWDRKTDKQTDSRPIHRPCSAYNRERKCADTIGTVLVPWAGHFHC